MTRVRYFVFLALFVWSSVSFARSVDDLLTNSTISPDATIIDRRILPVVGSAPGTNGTFFRTSVQLNNPGSASMTGRIVFHPSGAAGSDTDPALSYSLAAGQTLSIADLLHAMGVSGLGSADIEITSGSAPIVSARVFNDAGPSGTTGFTEEAMRAEEAVRAGQTGVLLIPSDFTMARFNVGIRTLEEGASVTFTLRNATGAVFESSIRAFPPDYHEQLSAAGFLGVFEVQAGGSISIAVNSGAAFVYGVTVDNATGDPSLQVSSPSWPEAGSPTPTQTPLPPSPTATPKPTRILPPLPIATPTPTPNTDTDPPPETPTPNPTPTPRAPTPTPNTDTDPPPETPTPNPTPTPRAPTRTETPNPMLTPTPTPTNPWAY